MLRRILHWGAGWTPAVVGCILLVDPPEAGAQGADSAKAPPVTTWTGVYSAEQAGNGKNVFLSSCQSCHAVSEIADGILWTKWVGKTVNTIFSYLRENMPQDNPGGLSEEDYARVTAYILQLNAMPPGPKELPTDTTALGKIQVVRPDTTKKPPLPRFSPGHRS